jgi:hypothetical protein
LSDAAITRSRSSFGYGFATGDLLLAPITRDDQAVKRIGPSARWCTGQRRPPTGYDFVQLETADFHVCGFTSDQQIVCWGSNFHGESTPP